MCFYPILKTYKLRKILSLNISHTTKFSSTRSSSYIMVVVSLQRNLSYRNLQLGYTSSNAHVRPFRVWNFPIHFKRNAQEMDKVLKATQFYWRFYGGQSFLRLFGCKTSTNRVVTDVRKSHALDALLSDVIVLKDWLASFKYCHIHGISNDESIPNI